MIRINYGFSCINGRQVPRKMLKAEVDARFSTSLEEPGKHLCIEKPCLIVIIA